MKSLLGFYRVTRHPANDSAHQELDLELVQELDLELD